MERAFRIDMNGMNQNPDSASTAKGIGIAIFNDGGTPGDKTDDTLTYTIDVTGLDWGPFTGGAAQTAGTGDDVTDAHFHQSSSATNGPVKLVWKQDSDFAVTDQQLIGGVPFARLQGVWDNTEATGAQSFSNFSGSFSKAMAIGAQTDFYANIHTTTFATGAIRGQLTLIADDNNNTVNGLAGVRNDMLFGLGGNDTINGGAGDDTIDGGAGNDKISGGAGNDTMDGFSGINTLDFSYLGAASGVTATLGETDVENTTSGLADDVDKFKNFQNMIGGAGGDVLTGNDGDNVIDGGAGDDTIDGGKGNDTTKGGAGNDTLEGGKGDDTLDYSYLGAAAKVTVTLGDVDEETLTSGIANDVDKVKNFENIIGGAGGDNLTGNDAGNVIEGRAGDDTIAGGDGDDIVDGGAGNDDLAGGEAGETVGDVLTYASATAGVTVDLSNTAKQNTVGAGQDTIHEFEFEFLRGSKFNDKLTGDLKDNQIFGEEGNDVVEGGAGADHVDGGSGTNTVSYFNDTAGVTVNMQAETNAGGDAQGDLVEFFTFQNLQGGLGGDKLTGNNSVNKIEGLGGDDTVRGGSGNDTLDGGFGATPTEGGIDTVDFGYLGAGLGVTVTLGMLNAKTGAVAATKTSGAPGDIDSIANFENVTGGDGNDVITGNAGTNTLLGGDGDDFLKGLGATDDLQGGDGSDQLDGGIGNDLMDGGADGGKGDTANYASSKASVTVDLGIVGAQDTKGAGVDSLTEIENLTGGSGADKLTGDAGDNIIEGGLGNDTLIGGGSGANGDTVSYAGSTGAVTVNLLTNQAKGAAGTDSLTGFVNIIGGKGKDVLTTDGGNKHTIDGGDGDDLINSDGNSNDETLIGGKGIDTASFASAITGGMTINLASGIGERAGDDIVTALSGIENIVGTDDDDIITGDVLVNKLMGGLGDDRIIGGDGNDKLDGGGGASAMVGGSDTVEYSYLSVNLTVTLGALAAKGAVAASTTSGVAGDIDTISNFENVIGGDGNDTITGNAGANALQGGKGDDLINGGSGNVIDILDGGDGNDTLSYAKVAGAVTVDLGTSTVSGAAGADVVAKFENIIGGSAADALTGGTGDNVIEGGMGNDRLDGGASAAGGDTLSYAGSTAPVTVDLGKAAEVGGPNDGFILTGGDAVKGFENVRGGGGADKLTGDGGDNGLDGRAGNDTLTGGAGEDTLLGGLGNDVIVGGADNDTLSGQGGKDVFFFEFPTDGVDTVMDFLPVDDTLRFDASNFGGGLAAGALPANRLVANATPAADQAFGQFLYDTDNGELSWDADGTGGGGAVLIATLTGAPAITVADFNIIA